MRLCIGLDVLLRRLRPRIHGAARRRRRARSEFVGQRRKRVALWARRRLGGGLRHPRRHFVGHRFRARRAQSGAGRLRLQRPRAAVLGERNSAWQCFDPGGRTRARHIARRRHRAHNIGLDNDVGRSADH